MLQKVLVGIILAVTVLFAVRWLVRTVKGKGGCGCGCDRCPYAGGKECHCKDGSPKLPEIKL
jgi:hypothetical protein